MNEIPYIAHESAMVRQERTIRRLWILCIIIFLAFVGSNGAWLYYENSFETTTMQIEAEQDAQGNGRNYIIGGDYGTAEGKDNSEKEDP